MAYPTHGGYGYPSPSYASRCAATLASPASLQPPVSAPYDSRPPPTAPDYPLQAPVAAPIAVALPTAEAVLVLEAETRFGSGFGRQ